MNTPDPFLRAWRGEERLGRAFWLYGVAGSCAILVFCLIAIDGASAAAHQVALLVFGLYTCWALVSIWRSASDEQNYDHLLARALAIPWSMNVLMIVLALEMELLF